MPAVVWRAVIDVAAYPAWRSGVSRVERFRDVDGRPEWCEVGPRGNGLKLRATRIVAGRALTLATVGEDLPYQCVWSIELQPHGTGTVVSVLERSSIHNVALRAIAHWFVGRDESVRLYLADLSRWSRSSAARRGVAQDA